MSKYHVYFTILALFSLPVFGAETAKCASNTECGYGRCDLTVGTCICPSRATNADCTDLQKTQLGALLVCSLGGCITGLHHLWLGDNISFGFQLAFFLIGMMLVYIGGAFNETFGVFLSIPGLIIILSLAIYATVMMIHVLNNSSEGPWPKLYPM